MDRRLIWFCALLAPVLGWSMVRPHDLFTWFLEVLPVLIGLPIALATQRRFPLSTLLLGLLWCMCGNLDIGGADCISKGRANWLRAGKGGER